MSKGRIIISTTTDNEDKHEAVRSHAILLASQFQKFPGNSLRHAIGMFEGKEELSIVIDIPDVPFIVLAASAHALCMSHKQKSVYFSHNGQAYLATNNGNIIRLGTEQEYTLGRNETYNGPRDYTRIIGTEHCIWTQK